MSFYYSGSISTSNINLEHKGSIIMNDDNNSNTLTILQPNSINTNFSLKLPNADGSNGQLLKTDGSGNLSFVSVAASAGGSDTFVQFNDNNIITGNSSFVYNKTADRLTTVNSNVTGTFTVGSGSNEFTITESSDNISLSNKITDKDIIFNINDGGTETEVLRLVGADSNVSVVGGLKTSNLHINSLGNINFYDDAGTGKLTILQPNVISTNYNLRLPNADGSNGNFLKTDGSGNLSFVSAITGANGSDTFVQFNDNGSFGGDAGLVYNKTADRLTTVNSNVTGTITAGILTISPTIASSSSSSTVINIDFASTGDYIYTLSTGVINVTISASNITEKGRQGTIIIKTPSSGSLSTLWNTSGYWYFETGIPPLLSSDYDVYDVFSYYIIDTNKVLISSSSSYESYTS
jgi:hypothetical protein